MGAIYLLGGSTNPSDTYIRQNHHETPNSRGDFFCHHQPLPGDWGPK